MEYSQRLSWPPPRLGYHPLIKRGKLVGFGAAPLQVLHARGLNGLVTCGGVAPVT
jgi:hypothetical protein